MTLSYGYLTNDRNADVIAKSAMDFMRHKAALAVEVHFLRRMSLALTRSVYDRNGSYTAYPRRWQFVDHRNSRLQALFPVGRTSFVGEGVVPPLCRRDESDRYALL